MIDNVDIRKLVCVVLRVNAHIIARYISRVSCSFLQNGPDSNIAFMQYVKFHMAIAVVRLLRISIGA